MTLRHRLLLVYLIVVLLSVATVGTAIYELNRTQQIYGSLPVWYGVSRDVQGLIGAFPERQTTFENLLTGTQQRIASVSGYLDDVEYIRDWYIIRIRRAYHDWKEVPPEQTDERAARAEIVQQRLQDLAGAVEAVRVRLDEAVDQQRTRKWALLGVAVGLGGLHVVLIGWLLRRWLLRPMGQLSRQVEALARDLPPPEPLLTAPQEMALLARALDQARTSLQVYRQQLIENERLTTIGQFAAQLAHNLRNPLASIRALAQLTSRRERHDAYVRERMQEVVACVDRLNHWIAGLMEVARHDPTPTRHADVVPVLQRVREAVQPELGLKEVTLTVEAPAEGLICSHDPATLEQSLIAMVVNAVEASPLGGRIILRAQCLSPAADGPPIPDPPESRGLQPARPDDVGETSETTPPAPTVCRISVIDEGPGLPAGSPELIFDFSYSTKQKGMGLGLGLARLALRRQGGEAHARNRTDGGAEVYVDLPIGQIEKRDVEKIPG